MKMNQNDLDEKINDNQTKIDDENDIDIKFEEFQKVFLIAFCITIHKSQGSTFNHSYTCICAMCIYIYE